MMSYRKRLSKIAEKLGDNKTNVYIFYDIDRQGRYIDGKGEAYTLELLGQLDGIKIIADYS